MSDRTLFSVVLLYLALLAFPNRNAASQYNGVELNRSTGNHLFLSVAVNQRSAWFAVDTGAALTIVDDAKAKILGLQAQSQTVLLPSQIEVNSRVVPVAQIANLQVGAENLGSGPVALVDLQSFSSRLRSSGRTIKMDGILGLDILERYKAVIDCGKLRIYLQNGNTDVQPALRAARQERLRSIPMRITRSGALEVPCRIGQNRYSMVVDTGGFTTLIPISVALKNGLPILRTTSNAKGIHAKERPVGVGFVPQFDVGKYSFGMVLVGVTALPEGPEDLSLPFGGLLGADFFFERQGIIDVGNKTLYFK